MEYFRDGLTPEPSFKLTKELLIAARIPRSLWGCSIDKIPTNFGYYTPTADYVKNIQTLELKGRGLYFYGPYGRGKSGAAVAVAKEAMKRGGRVLFFSSLELDPVFGKGEDEELRKAVLNTHFLVFDDVGAEKAIPWSPQWVETIIKLRNNDNLPTFITSNDKPVDFMGRIKSVASILGGRYQDIYVDGHDWRMDGPPNQLKPPEEPPKPGAVTQKNDVSGSGPDVIATLYTVLELKLADSKWGAMTYLGNSMSVSKQSIYNWTRNGITKSHLAAYESAKRKIMELKDGKATSK